jgi:hypothetical protein
LLWVLRLRTRRGFRLVGEDARRRSENGEDLDELPPARWLSAPGKNNVTVHVCMFGQRSELPARSCCSNYWEELQTWRPRPLKFVNAKPIPG